MNNRDLFELCIRNLLRRKTRTILAVVGVVVGTSAIIVMLSIGFGLSENFKQQIESYGNLHVVNVRTGGGLAPGASGSGGGKPAVLDDKAIAEFKSLPSVSESSPVVNEYGTFIIGKYIAGVSIIGMQPAMMSKLNYNVAEGRLLQAGDTFKAVFGNQIPMQFYNPKRTLWGGAPTGQPAVKVITDKILLTCDPMYGQKPMPGQENVVYKQYKIKGVGTLANPSDESAYAVYMDIKSVQQIRADNKKTRREFGNQRRGYDSAIIYVDNINEVEKISKTIRGQGFQTDSLSDWLKSMQDQARMIQGILGGIGAISLLVAALGITNTMIMSIYERTKEIGIMKVIGANLEDIQKMFLVEAGLIGLIGGIAGILFSFLVSLLMNTVLAGALRAILGGLGGGGSSISIIPWWVVVGALLFATGIGLVAGYSPARRAMKLSALESLRNE